MRIYKNKDSHKIYRDKNSGFYDRVRRLVESKQISLNSVVQNFPSFIQRQSLPKILANYELFKIVHNIPGSIIELGVFWGSGLFSWSHLLETFCPLDRSRKVYGFDHFEGYKNFSKNESALPDYFDDFLDGNRMTSSDEIIRELLDIHDHDGIFPGVSRAEIINGDITQSIPKFVKDHPGLRLSLIYVDINLYEPILKSLECLYDLLLPGGVLAFTGYSTEPWEGEAQAISDFFDSIKIKSPKMLKFPWSNLPRAYFVKD